MTDRDAHLRAIIEAPDDDAPRLVYADWLDENGEPERAEFIRLQCRLARMAEPEEKMLGIIGPHTWADERKANRVRCRRIAGPDLCDFHVAWSRARELIESNGYGWIDGLLGPGWKTDGTCKIDNVVFAYFTSGTHHTGKFGVEFRRGFPYAVGADAADWLAHADAILAAHPIQEVRLTTRPAYQIPVTSASLMAGIVQVVLVDADERDIGVGFGSTSGAALTAALSERWPTVKVWHLPEAQARRSLPDLTTSATNEAIRRAMESAGAAVRRFAERMAADRRRRPTWKGIETEVARATENARLPRNTRRPAWTEGRPPR